MSAQGLLFGAALLLWHETFIFPRAHFTRSPAAPGLNGVCEPSLPGTGMAFAGGPRCGPLATPLRRAKLAAGRSCRRLSGGRMLDAVVLHLLRADNSAGSAGHVKCREGLKAERRTRRNPFHGRGRAAKRPTMWVFGMFSLPDSDDLSIVRELREMFLNQFIGNNRVLSVHMPHLMPRCSNCVRKSGKRHSTKILVSFIDLMD